MSKYEKVRWLTIKEIAELWSPEIGIPSSIILRELQASVINIPRLVGGEPLVEELPADEDLASEDTRLDKSHVGLFCEKQGHWPKPRFWFGPQKHPLGFVGRPSVMPAIVQELERRAAANQLEDTLADQSRELARWAKSKLPGEQVPTARTIENNIRLRFKVLKRPT
jgi:hypothetical protein